jgi:hypothetical protein
MKSSSFLFLEGSSYQRRRNEMKVGYAGTKDSGDKRPELPRGRAPVIMGNCWIQVTVQCNFYTLKSGYALVYKAYMVAPLAMPTHCLMSQLRRCDPIIC